MKSDNDSKNKNNLLALMVIVVTCFAVYVAYSTHCRNYNKAINMYVMNDI